MFSVTFEPCLTGTYQVGIGTGCRTEISQMGTGTVDPTEAYQVVTEACSCRDLPSGHRGCGSYRY